jgi:hypothetical protein
LVGGSHDLAALVTVDLEFVAAFPVSEDDAIRGVFIFHLFEGLDEGDDLSRTSFRIEVLEHLEEVILILIPGKIPVNSCWEVDYEVVPVNVFDDGIVFGPVLPALGLDLREGESLEPRLSQVGDEFIGLVGEVGQHVLAPCVLALSAVLGYMNEIMGCSESVIKSVGATPYRLRNTILIADVSIF